jgi:hypothetical protein
MMLSRVTLRPSMKPAGGAAYNARAQYFFDQELAISAVSLGETLEGHINSLLDELISIGEVDATDTTGASDRLDALYLLHLGSAGAVKINVLRPLDTDAAFRLSISGGWTFGVNGALPNGTNGYMDTHWNSATIGALTVGSFGVYSRTNSIVSGGAYGVYYNPDHSNFRRMHHGFVAQKMGIGQWGDFTSYTGGVSTKFFMSTRRASNDMENYRDGGSIGTAASGYTTGTTGNFFFGATNYTGLGATIADYDNHEISIGVLSRYGYTDAQAAALNTAFSNYATSVGFNV